MLPGHVINLYQSPAIINMTSGSSKPRKERLYEFFFYFFFPPISNLTVMGKSTGESRITLDSNEKFSAFLSLHFHNELRAFKTKGSWFCIIFLKLFVLISLAQSADVQQSMVKLCRALENEVKTQRSRLKIRVKKSKKLNCRLSKFSKSW